MPRRDESRALRTRRSPRFDEVRGIGQMEVVLSSETHLNFFRLPRPSRQSRSSEEHWHRLLDHWQPTRRRRRRRSLRRKRGADAFEPVLIECWAVHLRWPLPAMRTRNPCRPATANRARRPLPRLLCASASTNEFLECERDSLPMKTTQFGAHQRSSPIQLAGLAAGEN